MLWTNCKKESMATKTTTESKHHTRSQNLWYLIEHCIHEVELATSTSQFDKHEDSASAMWTWTIWQSGIGKQEKWTWQNSQKRGREIAMWMEFANLAK